MLLWWQSEQLDRNGECIVGKKKRPAQMRAFNTRFAVTIIVLALSVCGIIYGREIRELWITCLVMCVAAILMLFLEPVFYVFTRKELISEFLFGYKKRLPWQRVKAVSEWRDYGWNWLKGNFTLRYYMIFKGRSIMQYMEIPITRRIREGLKNYYRGNIDWDYRSLKKKKKHK